ISLFFILGGSISCGRQERTEPKTPKNSPPFITSIRILPEHPTRESILSLVIQSQDPDGDLVGYRYQWLKNNEEMRGEDKETLQCNDLKKGDLVQVKVTPFDGKVKGEPFLSPPAKIPNAPPVIQEVRIEPKVAYANDNLKVFVRTSDANEDSIHYTYQWEKSGEKSGLILGEEKNETLQRGQFKKGDSIVVTVTPNDGESVGIPKKSEPIIISNSPPVIVSSPTNKIDGNIYTYQVKANDPDNDSVIFSLKTAPKGMQINKETSLIRWQIGKEDHGTQTIEIEASDSEGAKSFQRYTIAIEFR
ncbi:MAG: Ig domain-containing protein, partial [Desulfobacterales bacterium]|nr:Ig domain-containing protein [Desulfobacterales bacterium]